MTYPISANDVQRFYVLLGRGIVVESRRRHPAVPDRCQGWHCYQASSWHPAVPRWCRDGRGTVLDVVGGRKDESQDN